jgi:hypothetical protein
MGGVDRVHQDQGRGQYWALLNKVMNFSVPWKIISISREKLEDSATWI